MDLGLRGRTAIITGGSRGIGKTIARSLAAEGVNVVLVARNKDILVKAADEIRSSNDVRVLPIVADIKSASSIKEAAAAAAAQFKSIHILVNNAGSPIRRFDRQITWPDTDWIDDIDGKMIGALRCVQSFLPHMPHDGSGRIINISGIAGTSVFVKAMTHGINNSAMNHVTTYLAADLAGDRINVNAVVPGLIATEWREGWAENMAKQQGKTKEQFMTDLCRSWGILAGRWGTMQEVADIVVFLASDRAQYITGTQIAIDGGYGVNSRG
jgi:3-oxoacyl-[acyl-carrier protein] reductase